MLWLIILHLWLQFALFYHCHHFGTAAEECTCGFTLAHGRKLTLKKFLYLSLFEKNLKYSPFGLVDKLTGHCINMLSSDFFLRIGHIPLFSCLKSSGVRSLFVIQITALSHIFLMTADFTKML